MTGRIYWSKLWKHWFTSPANADLSGEAMALHGIMQLMCRDHAEVTKDNRGAVVWMLNEKGRPITVKAISSFSHFSTPRVRAALKELVANGHMVEGDHGLIGFTVYWEYQESKSAIYNRKARERDSMIKATKAGHSESKVNGLGVQSDLTVNPVSNNSLIFCTSDRLSPLSEGVTVEPDEDTYPPSFDDDLDPAGFEADT